MADRCITARCLWQFGRSSPPATPFPQGYRADVGLCTTDVGGQMSGAQQTQRLIAAARGQYGQLYNWSQLGFLSSTQSWSHAPMPPSLK